MQVYFHTFGCKSNQYETGQLEEKFRALGFGKTSDVTTAGIIVVNTCSVTHIAERKARNLIRKFQTQNPHAKLYVCGCYANIADFTKIIPTAIPIKQEIKLKPELWHGLPDTEPVEVSREPNNPSVRGNLDASTGSASIGYRVREFLKIQEGCDNFCSYCIIPYARPQVFSEPPEKILAEADKLCRNNVREIVLTGINLGRYQYQDKTLSAILQLLLRTDILRIRLSSLEPDLIPDELLKTIAAAPRIARHLHIPLQSGSDKILKLMRRKYTTAAYKKLIARVRKICGKNTGLTTDIIVGFPGETLETFSETLEFVRRIGFDDLHIFPYSLRPPAAAAQLTQTCTDKEQKQFIAELEALRCELKQNFLKKQKKLLVLAENERGGFSSEYAQIAFAEKVTSGEIYTAKPLEIKNEIILAIPVPQ